MTGLEQLQAMMAGSVPPPPMAEPMGLRLTEASHGGTTFAGAPDSTHLNPMGGVHGGWYGTILDSAMGCAVHSTLAAGERYATLEYKINITRALRPGTRVLCRATVQHRGRTTAVAQGEITGAEDGKVYGTGSTTCIIMAA